MTVSTQTDTFMHGTFFAQAQIAPRCCTVSFHLNECLWINGRHVPCVAKQATTWEHVLCQALLNSGNCWPTLALIALLLNPALCGALELLQHAKCTWRNLVAKDLQPVIRKKPASYTLEMTKIIASATTDAGLDLLHLDCLQKMLRCTCCRWELLTYPSVVPNVDVAVCTDQWSIISMKIRRFEVTGVTTKTAVASRTSCNFVRWWQTLSKGTRHALVQSCTRCCATTSLPSLHACLALCEHLAWEKNLSWKSWTNFEQLRLH